MITRGYFFGEIIDELETLSSQVAVRCKLGLTDLNVFSEDFFKSLLNIILDINLTNLNADRCNEPGLDLGDKVNKVAFQITSTATVAKVHKTLEKITDEQKNDFEKINVLVIGKKQGSYSLNSNLTDPIGFTLKNIWDVEDLSRLCLSLPLETLQNVHSYLRKNVARLKIDLEMPDNETGIYPTTEYDKWEITTTPTLSSFENFRKFCANVSDVNSEDIDLAVIQEDFKQLSRKLSLLPRITREFLVMLFEHRERCETTRNHGFPSIVIDRGRRLYGGKDFDDEVALLEHAGLVFVDAEDPYHEGLPEVRLKLTRNDEIECHFADFIESNNLTFRHVLGNVDFSKF